MPVTYEIDTAHGLITTRCVGDVTLGQVIEHFRELERDPKCPSRLAVMLNLTECSSIPESNQLKPVSESIGALREKVQFDACAIIVSNEIMFGMSRMFLAFADEYFRVAQVFRNADKAKEWLSAQSAGTEL